MTTEPSDIPTIPADRPGRPPSPEAIAPHFPHLDIMEVLGFGGMGVVYKARHRDLDRLVALKILAIEGDDTFAERFGREARALARLQHPSIVMVYDSGRVGDTYYFIMEYVDGTNLRRAMAASIAPDEALRVVVQVCEALQYAHEEGVMHRDIKPENILLDTRGRVKVADFGLAKLLQRPETDYALTAPAQVMGTMHYMAPEQVERPSDVDHRADIYALGVLIYEMLTGELPLGRFPLPSEKAPVDQRLDHIVLRALEKEPARRYQHMSEVKTDVEQLSDAPPGAPAAPGAAALAGKMSAVGGMPALRPSSINPAPVAGGPATSAVPPSSPGTPTTRYAYPVAERVTGVAYLLSLLWFFGLAGVHRFYTGRWITGFLWLLTWGFLGIAQFIDLFLMPALVRQANLEARYRAEVPR